MLKLKPRPKKQIPCLSSFSDEIICGLHRGSFAVRIISGPGISRGLGIICSAVQSVFGRFCASKMAQIAADIRLTEVFTECRLIGCRSEPGTNERGRSLIAKRS